MLDPVRVDWPPTGGRGFARVRSAAPEVAQAAYSFEIPAHVDQSRGLGVGSSIRSTETADETIIRWSGKHRMVQVIAL